MEIQRFSTHSKSLIFTLAVVLFLVVQLVPFKGLSFLLSFVSILAIAVSIRPCKFFTRWLSIIFLVLGTWMVGSKGISISSYIKLYGEMLYLLSLFTVVPLLSIPVQVGGYREAFEQLFQRKIKSVPQLYRVLTGLSYFLGSFLNMAAIPIMYSSVKSAVEAWPLGNHKRFLASGIIQGYSLPIIWTPLSGVVGVVLYVTKVPWLHVFPLLFSISLAALVLNWIIFSVMEGNKQSNIVEHEIAAAREYEPNEYDTSLYWKIIQILSAILLLLFLVVSIDAAFSFGLVVSVTFLTVPFAWLWCLLLGKSKDFWLKVKYHFTSDIAKMSELFAIFLSAGFFVSALHYSGNDRLVNELFVQFKELVGIHFFLILLPYITLLLAYIGLHPIVVVHLLAQSLKPSVLGITPEQMALAFLGGSVMTFYMGPFSGTIGLISSMINVAPLRIAAWSLVYMIGFSIILIAAIFLI